MQMTSPPFWLMMVSRITAVFPVWRSPMINSRWPRPMGIMLSIALMPVCKGSRTGWRSMTPGARRSSGLRSLVTIGPLPSSGCPSGFTTRPTSASPTGTDIIAFVRFTTSPSFSSVVSPSSTTPTCSSSRFSAIPYTSCGNASISPAITFSRPCTRAMPSPTLIIAPTSSTATACS